MDGRKRRGPHRLIRLSSFRLHCKLASLVATVANKVSSYQNLDQLESELAAVSTPHSKSYGKYLDIDEVNALFAPTAKSESQIKAWLESSGVKDIHSDGSLVTFATTVGKANKLLETEFKVYTDGITEKLRTTKYSVPGENSCGTFVGVSDPLKFFVSAAGSTKSFRWRTA